MQATRTVYSLYFPETRAVVTELWAEAPHYLFERNYTKRQDAMHEPFVAAWRRFAELGGVSFGDGFRSEYATSGASEGINAVLAHIGASLSPERPRIHVFRGEYEGYRHIAEAMNLGFVEHDRDPERYQTSLSREARPNDWFFVSEPSAIDGNSWSGFSEFVKFTAEQLPETRLLVDLTYVGAVARVLAIDLAAPNIEVVIASLSKPFGVYYHRIGVLLARHPFAGLFGNVWFKNLFSLALGERLVTRFAPTELPSRYRESQLEALRAMATSIALEPADVVLLANAQLPGDAVVPEPLREFVRVQEPHETILRVCLSPAMDQQIYGPITS